MAKMLCIIPLLFLLARLSECRTGSDQGRSTIPSELLANNAPDSPRMPEKIVFIGISYYILVRGKARNELVAYSIHDGTAIELRYRGCWSSDMATEGTLY
ncbi:hypothetical protein ASPVEDRAFT_374287 [Aspergillus versicolor CBS 583.65]|uniref:Uncharacterized protein n=1 Tax=Aspergillus versicolor CBS 583.65 TaxID=1036611 RepID=A0A1L9Q1X4_ASPVE|nr:uncharacterized protein ASPVEDRAFT_374287 [Aspergillus versicolor CBS 583.65]OJJ07764.1 hypothetical protein ASPVEDRAFT_374287 [Aspergillus versicolor CBS 583.65]